MRIGIYASYLGRTIKTGVEVFAEEVVSRLIAHEEHEFVLVGSLTRAIPFEGPNVRHVPLHSRGKFMPLLGKLKAIAKREGIDRFFFPTQYTWFGTCNPSVCMGFDVAWRHFPDYFPKTKMIAFDILVRNMVRQSSKILAISEATKRDLINLYNCPVEKIEVVHLGYDEKKYHPRQDPVDSVELAKYGLKRDKYLLFLGTLQKRKNLINLLRAYDLCSDSRPLVLAGCQGWYYNEIKAVINSMRRKSDVRELGYVSDDEKPSLYRGCGAFLYPSLYEGFGLPVLEAMACGCKVLTSNVSSLPEVIGDAGLAVDPNDVVGMAKAIDALAASANDSLRNAAVQRAKKFSWDNTATRTLSAIEEASV